MKWIRSSRSAQSTAPDPRALVGRGIDPIEEVAKLGHHDRLQRAGNPGGEIVAELKMDGRAQVDRHQVAGQDAPDDPSLLEDECVERDVQQSASSGQSGDPQPEPDDPRQTREQRRDDPIADVAWVHRRRVERLRDLRLQSSLLVEADLEIRQQDQLGADDLVRSNRARW